MSRNLTKRILSLLLALVLFVSSAPAAVFATEEAEAEQMAEEAIPRAAQTELEALIEQQLRAFAKSINQSNADDTASTDLAMHGMSQGGKKLTAGKSHALTATLLNSEIMIACLSKGCTSAIEIMQQLDRVKLENIGGYGIWKGPKDSTYGMTLYDSADKTTRKSEYALASGKGCVIDAVIQTDDMVRPMVPGGANITNFLLE